MSGGPLVAALLAVAIGLALARARAGMVRLALPLFGAGAAVALLAELPGLPPAARAWGLAGAALAALSVLWPWTPGTIAAPWAAGAAALLAGLLTGALAAGTGADMGAMGWVLPTLVAAALPARWAAATGRGIVLRVAASWVLAVIVLATGLALAPVTAGDAPDHLE